MASLIFQEILQWDKWAFPCYSKMRYHPVEILRLAIGHVCCRPCGLLPLIYANKILLEFFDGLIKRHPIFPISATPIYSNAAFQILGYALESLSNDTFENVFEDQILEALNLSHTFYTRPSPSLGVIPGGQGETFWNMDMGDENP